MTRLAASPHRAGRDAYEPLGDRMRTSPAPAQLARDEIDEWSARPSQKPVTDLGGHRDWPDPDPALLGGPEPSPVMHEPEDDFDAAPDLPPTGRWSAPPWMAPPSPARRPVEPPEPAEPYHAAYEAPTPAYPEDDRDFDDVASRMQRLRASAAAVREAVETESARLQSRAPARDPSPPQDWDEPQWDGRAAAEPAPQRAAAMPEAPAAEPRRGHFEDAFLGGDFDEDFEDDEGAGDFPDLAPERRPLPWPLIAVGAVGLAAIGAFVFRAQLFGMGPEPDVAAVGEEPAAVEASALPPGPGAEAEPTKAEPSPADAKAEPAPGDPQAGQPVVPAPTEPAPTGEVPTPPAAVPADPAVEGHMQQARDIYKNAAGRSSELKKAQAMLDKVLAADPKHPNALMLTAQIQLEQGSVDKALKTATSCIEVAPTMADCWLTLGVLRQDRKETKGAVEAYEKYLSLAPDGSYAGDVRKQLERLK